MGKFDGILLCTDFDGTFALSWQGMISRENCDAVRYFQENGGLFTIASGRSPDFVMSFDDFKCNAPIIAANGTMICDPATGEKLMTFPLPDSIEQVMVEGVALPFSGRMYICDINGHGNSCEHDSEVSVEEFCKSVPKPWFKVLFEQSPENTQKMKDWAEARWKGIFEFSRSWNGGLEFQALGTGKGESLVRLKEIMGNIRLTVGAGDYENDISLIRCADIGYAVANAVPEAKAAADRITVSNNEHAIARIIEELEREEARA